MRRIVLTLGLAAFAGACAGNLPPGPTTDEFAALVPGQTVRKVKCDFIVEEGSEWSCRYERRSPDGRWRGETTVVAIDGGEWILIDGPVSPADGLRRPA